MITVKLQTWTWIFAYFTFISADFVTALSEDIKDDNLSTIVLVNVIFRHGDRTPINPYPNDPYRDVGFWPEGYGQLTDLGKAQHFRLGQYIRQRYSTLLPAKYHINDVYVRSTDVDRTLMSAESNLAGMYPPIKSWQDGINWQPIPVHTTPESIDSLLAMKKPCPRYDEEYRKAMNSPEIRRINNESSALYDYLTKQTGEEIREPVKLEYVFNTLYIETLRNFTLPNWTRSVYPDKMIKLSAFSFTLAAYTKELQRLKGGPLLGEMVTHMKDKSKGTLTPDRKLFVYSAHDTTVSNILMTLGVFDAQTPSYASAVFIELHRSAVGDYSVSVLFRNQTDRDPYPLELPGCSFSCPLEQFIEITKPVIPENWEEECKLSEGSITSTEEEEQLLEGLTIATMVGSAMLALLFVIIIIVGVLYWRQKNNNAYWYLRVRTEDTPSPMAKNASRLRHHSKM